MKRSELEHARSVQYDDEKNLVYVYVRFPDRVDVYKFTRAEVVEASSGEALLSVSEPRYRVTSGACTCEGYEFRQKCRHATWVAHLSTSDRTGWRNAAK